MIAALLCAIAALTLALLLPDAWSLLALPPAFLGMWLWAGGGVRWLKRRTGRGAGDAS